MSDEREQVQEMVQTMYREEPREMVQTMYREEPQERVQTLQMEKPVYQQPYGGEVRDTVAINNIRDEQNRDIIDNARLGNYNTQGKYEISPQITEQLLKIPKFLVNTTKADKYRQGSDVYDLQTKVPHYDDIEFKLIVSTDAATLYLVENVFREAGGYLEVYEEFIGVLPIEKGETMPIDSIFAIFNIKKSGDNTDIGKAWADGDYDDILIRKIYLNTLAQNLLAMSATAEREAFEKITTILKGSGEYGKKVLKAFIERVEGRPEILKIKDTPGYNRALNDVLMSVIDIVTTPQDLKDEKIKQTFDEITTARNEKINKILPEAKKATTADIVKDTYIKIKGAVKSGDLIANFEDKFKIVRENVDRASVRIERATGTILKQGQGSESRAALLKQQPLTEKERLETMLNKKQSIEAVAGKGEKPVLVAAKKEKEADSKPASKQAVKAAAKAETKAAATKGKEAVAPAAVPVYDFGSRKAEGVLNKDGQIISYREPILDRKGNIIGYNPLSQQDIQVLQDQQKNTYKQKSEYFRPTVKGPEESGKGKTTTLEERNPGNARIENTLHRGPVNQEVINLDQTQNRGAPSTYTKVEKGKFSIEDNQKTTDKEILKDLSPGAKARIARTLVDAAINEGEVQAAHDKMREAEKAGLNSYRHREETERIYENDKSAEKFAERQAKYGGAVTPAGEEGIITEEISVGEIKSTIDTIILPQGKGEEVIPVEYADFSAKGRYEDSLVENAKHKADVKTDNELTQDNDGGMGMQ